jgi:hypothetical protein
MSYIGTAFTSEVANAGAINKLLQSVGAMTAFFITPLFGRHTADAQHFLYEVPCCASRIFAPILHVTLAFLRQVVVDGALLAGGVVGVAIFLLALPAASKSTYDGM